jgi:hypothetical protein
MKKALLLTKSKNRMHRIAYLLVAGVLAFCCCCCNRDHATLTPEELYDSEGIEGLEGTKWKLAGIVDVKTGILTELEPKNCERCYTLVFESDSIAWGYSVLNRMQLCLSPKLIIGIVTYIYDNMNGDVQLLYDAMETMGSYAIKNNEMKLFYNNKRNYLLYKSVQQ